MAEIIPMLQKFYITYGFGSNLSKCYSEVEGVDYHAARTEVHRVAGTDWAFMYTATEFRGKAEEYNLTKVPLQAQVTLKIETPNLCENSACTYHRKLLLNDADIPDIVVHKDGQQIRVTRHRYASRDGAHKYYLCHVCHAAVQMVVGTK